MKSTGIIRRLDDLGRIAIPKEIRRTLQWHEGDPVELFVDKDETLCMRKYLPLATALGEEAETLISSFKHVFGGEIIVSDETGYIVASTERTFKEKMIDGMDAVRSSLFSDETISSIGISGYGNNISGCFPIAYESGGYSKRCEGAVFVIGNAEAGQQMAKVIAITLAERLKDYI